MKTKITSFLALLLFLSISVQAKAPSFKVVKTGKGPAMILIPGLNSAGEVWDETVAHYQKNYTCYVLTLPGFAGQPAVKTDHLLNSVRDEIIAYVQENKLKKPVVVGHSLGGYLALALNVKAPELFGKTVVVDGLPYIGAAQDPAATVESIKPMAEQMKKSMGKLSPEMQSQMEAGFGVSMATDSAHIKKIIDWGRKSDYTTTGQAMYEMYLSDLRSDIAVIKAPVLVLGAWAGYKNYGITKALTTSMYTAQFAKLPTAEVKIADSAKHFIMYDEPTWMFAQMDAFLKK
ncbi:alpha/beta fold hydrolase [Rufibacter sediminis]|uniref:Alpha/beta hydrolase n=1 Tax=Rufibacter sediminis TaxID=2762756 RepID=A0ABR6VX99_9BACT|nr:alpha/beta hydrolase [Rufibacter sediminis]MBC3541769.1 alpha/beta hydrolase [Rufibacter sediminis]